MMRIFAKALLVLAAVVWAGTASAGTISAVNLTDGGDASSIIHAPSDIIEVEIRMDSAGVVVSSYFFHVGFEESLVLLSAAPYGPYPYPTGSPNAWAPLAGNLSVDAYGLYLNSYASGGKSRPGVFSDTWITTLVFHVADTGDGELTVTPYFNPPADVIGDADNNDIASQFALNSVSIHTPEPTTALLFGLGLLGIAYAGRRR